MNINKLSKIIAIIFIILVVGGLALGLISGGMSYYKQKHAFDELEDQGLSAEIVPSTE